MFFTLQWQGQMGGALKKTVFNQLVIILVFCMMLGPLACLQFQPRHGDLRLSPSNYSGREITNELFGWPFMTKSRWKNDRGTRGVTYNFEDYHPTSIGLNIGIAILMAALACLFVLQLQHRPRFKLYLFDIFAATFGIACCLAVHQFGRDLHGWAIANMNLDDESDLLVESHPMALMLYGYLFCGAFAIFQLLGRFLNPENGKSKDSGEKEERASED